MPRLAEYLLFWPTLAFALFLASNAMVDRRAARANPAFTLLIDTTLSCTHVFAILVLILSMVEMYTVVHMNMGDEERHMDRRQRHLEIDSAISACGICINAFLLTFEPLIPSGGSPPPAVVHTIVLLVPLVAGGWIGVSQASAYFHRARLSDTATRDA